MPAFPKAGDEDDSKGNSVEQLFCLEAGHAPGELWAEPSPGGGTDQPALHSICLNEQNPDQVRVAISCGGAWQSNDKGASWECRAEGMRAAYMPPAQAYDPNIQDPHCMQHSKRDPDNLWVQHHNGIFHSTNGGEKWEEIKAAGPSTFGFVVCTPR